MELETFDIVKFIEENPISKLTKSYQSKLVNKIKDTFSSEEHQLFLASFFCYLNYKKDEFVIDLDSIWKWLGYAQKVKAKELLEKYFKLDFDYQIVFSQNGKNIKGGRPKDKFILTVNTFKCLCMKANTSKAEEIHKYFIKLEETLHEVIDEESSELRKELQFKDYLLEKNKKETEKLQQQIEKKKRKKYERSNSVYIISNPSIKTKKKKKFFKIGKTSNRNGRLENYGSGAPLDYKIEYSRELCSKREETTVENMMLIIFDNNRAVNEIKSKREWITGLDLDILKKELDIIVDFMESRKNTHDQKFILKNDVIKTNVVKETVKVVENELQEICVTEEVEESLNTDTDTDTDVDEFDSCEETANETAKPEIEFIFDDDDETEEIKVPQNNPSDFDKFISDCCIVDKDNSEYFTPKSDLRNAHHIWSNCTLRKVKAEFEAYLIKNFKSGATFIDKSRRNIYRGLKLKDLVYTPSEKNLDFEQFITNRCCVNYHYRISYGDFYEYFEKFKKETDSKYKLTKEYKQQIKKYLNSKFLEGRVYISNVEKSSGLHGVYGVGIKDNNFGLKIPPRKNKQVGEYNITTNELLQTFDSIILASETLKIPFSSLGNYIRFGNVIKGKIYKLLT